MTRYRIRQRGVAWRAGYETYLADPEALLAAAPSQFLQHSLRTTVALVRLEGVDLVLKLFDEGELGLWLEGRFLGSAARRAARSARRMRDAGFQVPELVAVLEAKGLWGCRKSCLVTLLVPGGPVDKTWKGLGRRERLRFASGLGGYVRSLHEAGLYPQDLRSANLIARRAGQCWEFVLVDLDRVRSYRVLSLKRRLKNLVQLQRSLGRLSRPGEQSLFLRSYLGDVSRERHREFLGRLLAMTARKDREYQKRARDQRRLVRWWKA